MKTGNKARLKMTHPQHARAKSVQCVVRPTAAQSAADGSVPRRAPQRCAALPRELGLRAVPQSLVSPGQEAAVLTGHRGPLLCARRPQKQAHGLASVQLGCPTAHTGCRLCVSAVS